MDNVLTTVGSTVIVFTVTQILTWAWNKVKTKGRKRRRERGKFER